MGIVHNGPIGDQSTMSEYTLAIRSGSDLYTYEVIDKVTEALSKGKADRIFPTSMSLIVTYITTA